MASKKTFSEIVAEGLANAGNKNLTVSAKKNLNSWLRSRYKDWLWPFLRASVERLSLPAGTTSLLFGGGGSDIEKEILRLLDPIWLSDAQYNSPTKAHIINLNDMNLINENRVNNPATVRGIPRNFKVREVVGELGVMSKEIIPIPVPDKQYYISFDCIFLPEDLNADGDIPLYPNDSTMILFVEFWARKYMNGPDAPDVRTLQADLATAVAQDRIKDGLQVGTNDSVALDNSVFL